MNWRGLNERPELPTYLRPTKRRLKSLDEFEPPPWKGHVSFSGNDRVTIGGVVRETFGWLGTLRPLILGGILLSIGWAGIDPVLVEPPSFLASEREPVNNTFLRCGEGAGHACVVDGDTFRLGDRRIRIIGIDTPEVKARCPEEARLAEAATARLQALLNDGPFEMVGRIDNPTDRYGRELRALRRMQADGSHASIAQQMRDEGHARRYLGGFRSGWC